MKKILVGLIIIVSIILTIVYQNLQFLAGFIIAFAIYIEPFAFCVPPIQEYDEDED
jgi:hypothetical protein